MLRRRRGRKVLSPQRNGRGNPRRTAIHEVRRGQRLLRRRMQRHHWLVRPHHQPEFLPIATRRAREDRGPEWRLRASSRLVDVSLVFSAFGPASGPGVAGAHQAPAVAHGMNRGLRAPNATRLARRAPPPRKRARTATAATSRAATAPAALARQPRRQRRAMLRGPAPVDRVPDLER